MEDLLQRHLVYIALHEGESLQHRVLEHAVVVLQFIQTHSLEEIIGDIAFDQFVDSRHNAGLGLFERTIFLRLSIHIRDGKHLKTSEITRSVIHSTGIHEFIIQYQFIQQTDTHLIGEQVARKIDG